MENNEPFFTIEPRELTRLKDGSLYKGEWNHHTGFRHGKGKIIYADESIYEGYWAHGKRQGRGILILPTNEVFEGYFINDDAIGPGNKSILKNS